MTSDRECANKYAEQLGVPPIESLTVDDFIIAMSFISSEFRGFFIIKFDGERVVGRYTFALNLIEEKGLSLRKDVDSIVDGIEFIFSELYNNNIIINNNFMNSCGAGVKPTV
ncbi:hypothetical protein [Xanthomonas oryzae]|uniref:Uncharacterized protein n=1 Tax=Xanthomonas oryzae pv. leersiae TaxID=3112258 RepID=A0AAJ6GY06_9XANT|nr:hypothetical protein [Xanthomonas oryzae]WIX06575.1 hypothetical protein QN060_21555 [Xanthomonas oryzae pv. oryzae]